MFDRIPTPITNADHVLHLARGTSGTVVRMLELANLCFEQLRGAGRWRGMMAMQRTQLGELEPQRPKGWRDGEVRRGEGDLRRVAGAENGVVSVAGGGLGVRPVDAGRGLPADPAGVARDGAVL